MGLYLHGYSAEKAKGERVHFPLAPDNTVCMSIALGLQRGTVFLEDSFAITWGGL